MKKLTLLLIILTLLPALHTSADTIAPAPCDSAGRSVLVIDGPTATLPDPVSLISPESSTEHTIPAPEPIETGDLWRKHSFVTPYSLPYTTRNVNPDWHRMWINTAVLSGAFVGTLFVLELLPEDATAWNRAAIQQTPMFKRWFRNVFKRGPEWDHDNPIFNYVLHPYAGAAYFMAARSCGFGFWESMLYSAAISTVGWEFGIEAFMERPSYQDLFVTPVIGSLLGELCYRGKRSIVNRGYEMFGSPVVGHIACFFLDPVNEVIDLFRDNPTAVYGRSRRHVTSTFMPTANGFALTVSF